MSSSKSPRPILKRSATAPQHPRASAYCHAVHFPPSPSLARTFDAHSAASYDRSPITVSPNSCALPERGCPGRTYSVDDDGSKADYAKFGPLTPAHRGGHVHPRAFYSNMDCNATSFSSTSYLSTPPLVPDLSSESEESDGFASPPPEPYSYSYSSYSSTPRLPSSNSRMASYPQRNDKYPSSYHPSSYHSYAAAQESMPEVKVRRYRDSRDRARMSTFEEADDPGYEDDRDIPSPPSPSTRKHSKRTSMSSVTQSMSSFGIQDDSGCLGGF